MRTKAIDCKWMVVQHHASEFSFSPTDNAKVVNKCWPNTIHYFCIYLLVSNFNFNIHNIWPDTCTHTHTRSSFAGRKAPKWSITATHLYPFESFQVQLHLNRILDMYYLILKSQYLRILCLTQHNVRTMLLT